MAVFTVAVTSIPSGAERRGVAVDPPDTVTAAFVQLVDGGAWDTTPGTVTRWGVQASRADGTFANDGTDWQNQGSVFQDNLPFGSRNRKDGSMPSLTLRSFDQDGNPLPIAPAGVKLRLALQVTRTISLGATVKTNADAA